MHKEEFIKYITTKESCTTTEAKRWLEVILASMTDALAEGNDLAFMGFGSFFVRERTAREGINPKTKEKINIPSSKVVSFKMGKLLKDRCNKP